MSANAPIPLITVPAMGLHIFSVTAPPERKKMFSYSFEETPIFDETDLHERILAFAPIEAYLTDLYCQGVVILGEIMPSMETSSWRWSHEFPQSMNRSLKISVLVNHDGEFHCHSIKTRSFLKFHKSSIDKLSTSSPQDAIGFLCASFNLPFPSLHRYK